MAKPGSSTSIRPGGSADRSDTRVGARSISGPGGRGRRRSPLAWLPGVGLLLLLLIALLVVLVVFNPADEGDKAGLDLRDDKEVIDGAAGPAAGTPAAPPAGQTAPAPSGQSGPGLGTLTASGRSVLDEASAGRYAQLHGQPVEGRAVSVQSVVADEGFWAGASEQNRVFIFLTPQARTRTGESPFQVRAGQRVDLTGSVKAVPADLTPFGVDQSEGAAQLRSQGHYIEATSVRLS